MANSSDTPHYPQDVPFEVPEGWAWCLLEELAYVAAGSTPNKDAFVAKGIPYIKMYNLRVQKIDFDFHPQYIKREIHEGKLHRSRTEIGDLLMNIVGPPLGKLAVIPSTLPEGNFNQAAVLIRPYHHKELLVKYLFYYLSEMSEINSISTKGSAGQVNISLTQSQNMRIPLPPLAEQQRIVEEIERLFKLIDIIEQGKADLQTTITQTKNKILDLAIHGKLVPQDPNDEPASELLKRINPKAQITCDNEHYPQLPKGWIELKIGMAATYTNGRAFKPEEWMQEGLPIIRIQNLNDNTSHYNRTTKTYEARFLVKNSDLLFAWAASLGTYIWEGGNAWLNQHIFKVEPYSFVNKKFLYYAFKAMVIEFYRNSHGSGMVHITKNQFENINLLLPPLEEQKRIVNKIEELFAALDTIEQSLQA